VLWWDNPPQWYSCEVSVIFQRILCYFNCHVNPSRRKLSGLAAMEQGFDLQRCHSVIDESSDMRFSFDHCEKTAPTMCGEWLNALGFWGSGRNTVMSDPAHPPEQNQA
jgi:hypothetical protein